MAKCLTKVKAGFLKEFVLMYCLILFPFPQFPKSLKISGYPKKRFALRIAISWENSCIGAEMQCFTASKKIVSISCLQRRSKKNITKKKEKKHICWKSLHFVSLLIFWKLSNHDSKWYMAMFLHPKHFYKSFAPSLSLNKIFLSNTPNDDHQQLEVRSRVLIKEIHK